MHTPTTRTTATPLDIRADSLDGAVALSIAGRARADALDRIKAVLDGLSPAETQRLHLRLHALDSCDTPVAWELLEFIRDAKDGGTEVVIESHPDMVVSTILMLADVRDDLGLRAAGDGSRT